MAAATLSNLILSSHFLGSKLPINANSKNSTRCRLLFRSPRCAADGSFGGNTLKFPRSNVWDPYKRLGIPTDASEEEVWSSRNFLLNQYGGHERSAESIEAAFEKILMTSFLNREKNKDQSENQAKKRKLKSLRRGLRTWSVSVEVPPSVIILRRFFLFAFMGAWSVMNSAEAGPAFQVALSLIACIYFLYDKSKSLARAGITGFTSLVVGWIVGSILVPSIPAALLHPTWTLELLTSLVAYIFLFLGCTFLK